MNYKILLKAILIFPLVLAVSYAIFILSYILVPVLITIVVGVIIYAALQVIEEEKNRNKDDTN